MKFTKVFIAIFSLIFSIGAYTHEKKPFICVTQLDYRYGNEIKTIDLVLRGNRSETDTLTGGVSVTAGSKKFHLNLPAVYLSNYVVTIKGTNTREQISLDFSYMENSGGTQNLTNRASILVKHGSFYTWATTEILSTEDANDAYEVNCDITRQIPI
jgi:hypothetical protein